MPRPNLFIVGAAKCGTTSLHAYLRQHPGVFMSDPKEPRFFDVDMPADPRWSVRDPDDYARLFAEAPGHAVVGEASPSYLVSGVAARAIHEYNPAAKILISLRNPVDFMFSLHRQFVGSCNDDLHDFGEALEAEADRAQGRRLPKSAHYPRQLLYRHNARFAEQVERYLDRFGPDQVKVLLMEDLGADPAGVFAGVLDFLGLPGNDAIDFSVRNTGESKRLRNFRIRALMKRYPLFEKLVRSVPVSLGTALSDTLVKVTGETADAGVKMDPALREKLTEEFGPEIDRLGRLIGRDLSPWRQPPASGPTPPRDGKP